MNKNSVPGIVVRRSWPVTTMKEQQTPAAGCLSKHVFTIVSSTSDEGEEAFRQVFASCYENLCQYAFTIVRDMDEAEDIVQNMFVKLWEMRTTLEIHTSARSYLFRAVYRQCLNAIDHRTVRQKHHDMHRRTYRMGVQQPEVFPDELEAKVREAIGRLPEQCRIIFQLSRYDELRYAEIAARLGISVNTVENQISKALKQLRLELKDMVS